MATNDDVYTYRLHLQEQDSKKQRTTQILRVNKPLSRDSTCCCFFALVLQEVLQVARVPRAAHEGAHVHVPLRDM